MAVTSRGRTLELPRQWKDRETSPERTKVWTEPKPKAPAERKVPVVYYLSRNGHLEHPHFMEVTISSGDGLYLRDVLSRLDYLRGKGMANMYSWSSKRSYKNGFVWHDLSEDDFIHPVHGHDYVLKGSELLQGVSSCSQEAICAASASSSSSSERSLHIPKSVHDDTDSAPVRRKKAPWHSFDLNEYKVYKSESTADAAVKAADASTQTDDRRQSRRGVITDDRCRGGTPQPEDEDPTTELARDEISPPPSSSSPETLETLIKADVRASAGGRVGGCAAQEPDQAAGAYPSGRGRASAVLMHLISCGSLSVKDHGFSVISQYRARLSRGCGPEAPDQGGKDTGCLVDRSSFPAVSFEDKEYFSGSLIETKKKASEAAGDMASLKRSSSFNADRSSKLDLADKEIDGVRAKCIPRRPSKSSITRKESGNKGSNSSRRSDGIKQTNDQRNS